MRKGARMGASGRSGRADAAIGLLASALLAGCAGDLTSGGVGELEVVVVGDTLTTGGLASSVSELLAPYLEGTASSHGGPHLVGDVTVWMQTYVRRGIRDWVEVTDGRQEVTVSIPGGEAQIAVRPDFPAGEYTHVRNRFFKLEVEIVQGLDVAGEPITGLVTVYFGLLGRADAPQPIELTLDEGSTDTLVVELRAGTWLPRLNRFTRRVAADDFVDALRVRRRPGPSPP